MLDHEVVYQSDRIRVILLYPYTDKFGKDHEENYVVEVAKGADALGNTHWHPVDPYDTRAKDLAVALIRLAKRAYDAEEKGRGGLPS